MQPAKPPSQGHPEIRAASYAVPPQKTPLRSVRGSTFAQSSSVTSRAADGAGAVHNLNSTITISVLIYIKTRAAWLKTTTFCPEKARCHRAVLGSVCQRHPRPLWIISGHCAVVGRCLLYPRKRTFVSTISNASRLLSCHRH